MLNWQSITSVVVSGKGGWRGGQGEENERGARLGPSGPVINNSGGVIDSLIT